MVEGGLVVGVTTLVMVSVLLWRIWVVETTIHERVDQIDMSLGSVVGLLIEKLDGMADRAISITENPIGQILEFLKSSNPNKENITAQPSRNETGQFIEVDSIGKTESKENKTP